MSVKDLFVMGLTAFGCAASVRGAEDAVLANDVVEFRFSAAHDFALERVTDRRTGTTFRFALDGTSSLWSSQLLARENVPTDVTPCGAPERVDAGKGSVSFVWTDAKLSVTLPAGSGIAEWRFEWKGKAAWPYSFTYPNLQVRRVGEADRLYYPQRIGNVLEDPVGRSFSVIPISPNWWSSQFVLYSASPTAPRTRARTAARTVIDGAIRGARADEATLYLSTDDPAFWRKDVLLLGEEGASSFAFGVTHYPAWPKRPVRFGEGAGDFAWKVPYVVRFGVVPGGVAEGAAVYRRQSERYLQRGKGRVRSSFLLQRPAWRSIHLPPADLTRLAYNMRDYYRVPVGLHHYESTLERFNWHFPEFQTHRAHFRDENEYLRRNHCRAMPYGNVIRFDRTLASYQRLHGETTGIRDINGIVRGDHYKGVVDTFVAWGDPTWTDYHREMVELLFRAQKVGGYYMDEGCGSARFDYNPAHGGVHGGTYVADGFRRFSDVLRRTARQYDPDAYLVTEGYGEHLMGSIDAFLVYGLMRPSGLNAFAKGFDHFPVTTYVSHDRTIGISDHPDSTLSDDTFRLTMAQAWAWGLQTQSLGTDEELAKEAAKAAYCRAIARSSWQVGARYFGTGEGLFAASVTNAAEVATAPVAAVSDAVAIPYRDLTWCGPRVLAGAFRDGANGNVALALANLTDREAPARVVLDARRFGGDRRRLFRSWPLPVAELKKSETFDVRLDANDVMLLEWRDDAPTVRPLLPAPEPLPDWVATAEADLADPSSARTYLAEFVAGALCVEDAREPGRFETTMRVANHVHEPLEIALEPGGRFRVPPMKEVRLPIAVAAPSRRDAAVIPVTITTPTGRPRREVIRFGAVKAALADEVACLRRPLRYPVRAVPERLPFTVEKGAKEFSFYPSTFGEILGFIRNPKGEIVEWGVGRDEFLMGTRYTIPVPPGTDGREWTYQHLFGKAYVAFGEGVRPVRRGALGGRPAPTVQKGVGFECSDHELTVDLPKADPSGRWEVLGQFAFHGKFPELLVRCTFPEPRAGHVTCPFTQKASGCRVTGYVQAFVQRADGVREAVVGDQGEQRARKGKKTHVSLDLPEPVPFVEVLLRLTGAPKYELVFDNLNWKR